MLPDFMTTAQDGGKVLSLLVGAKIGRRRLTHLLHGTETFLRS